MLGMSSRQHNNVQSMASSLDSDIILHMVHSNMHCQIKSLNNLVCVAPAAFSDLLAIHSSVIGVLAMNVPKRRHFTGTRACLST